MQKSQLTGQTGLSFNCLGFRDKFTNQRVPVDTEEILLYFGSNVNYFHNKSVDEDLRVLGMNEKNTDCVCVYNKDSGKRVSISPRLISHYNEGDELLTFYQLDGTEITEVKKRIMVVSLNEKLAGNTPIRLLSWK
ncbi:MAG: hypothetical protein PHR65_10750 [Syntrophomonadaceae bacterium]|nr:hypothetical protein [Syntrophomonadaceae bacterium]MDD3890377.1 hypothetical protein [Syntrophomonadaceae bacterium]